MFKCLGLVLLCVFWGTCSGIWMIRLPASAWSPGVSRYASKQELLPCKSFPKNLLFQLLGLSIAMLSTVTHYGPHFTLIRDISLESNSYRVIHHTGTLRSHPSKTFGKRES